MSLGEELIEERRRADDPRLSEADTEFLDRLVDPDGFISAVRP